MMNTMFLKKPPGVAFSIAWMINTMYINKRPGVEFSIA
jgi:hypothetical protein